MKRKEFWFTGLVLLMVAMLSLFRHYRAQAEPPDRDKLEWEKLAKELNLTSEKAAEFQAIGAKYSQTRTGLIEKLKQNEVDLEKTVAAPKPDEAKIKELVPVIIADHNQLFESFKTQRQEEMTLLTPVQQAKYLLALKKWHEENCEKAKAGNNSS